MDKKLYRYQRLIARYNQSSLLRFISRVTWEGGEKLGLSGPQAMWFKYYQHIFSNIAKYALLFAKNDSRKINISKHYKARKRGTRRIVPEKMPMLTDIDKFVALANKYYAITPQSDTFKYKKVNKTYQSNSFSLIVRMGFQQNYYQRDFKLEIGRTLCIYNEILCSTIGRKYINNYNNAYQMIYGMSLNKFLVVAYAIQAAYMHGCRSVDDISHLCRTMPSITKGDYRLVADKLITTQRKYRREYGGADTSFDHYKYNPLQNRPIVRLRNDELVIPSFYYYQFRLIDGVYYDLFNHFKEASGQGNSFTSDFGICFENYVDLLFRYSEMKYEREIEYGGKRFADFAVREDDIIILMECKTKRFVLETKVTGDSSLILKDLTMGVIAALKQISKKIHEVRSKARGLELFHGVKEFIGVVIMSDYLYFADTKEIRELVEDYCRENKIEIEFEYHIMEIQDIEKISILYKSGMPWVSILEIKKKEDEYRKTMNAADDVKIVYHKEMIHPLLKYRYESVFDEIENMISKIEHTSYILPYLLEQAIRTNQSDGRRRTFRKDR